MSSFSEAFAALLASYRTHTGRTGTVTISGVTYDGIPSVIDTEKIPIPGMEAESGGGSVQCRASDFTARPPKFSPAKIEDRDELSVLNVTLANDIFIISVGDPANE